MTDPAGPPALALTVTFGGGAADPIPTAARFVLGVGELAGQLAARRPAGIRLRVASLHAGDGPAVLELLAGSVPEVDRGGLTHLITRLAEQIAVEDGIAALVRPTGRP